MLMCRDSYSMHHVLYKSKCVNDFAVTIWRVVFDTASTVYKWNWPVQSSMCLSHFCFHKYLQYQLPSDTSNKNILMFN